MALSQFIDEKVLPDINAALSNIDTLEREYELAKRAGLVAGPSGQQFTEIRDRAAEAKRTLLAIKSVYFPGQ